MYGSRAEQQTVRAARVRYVVIGIELRSDLCPFGASLVVTTARAAIATSLYTSKTRVFLGNGGMRALAAKNARQINNRAAARWHQRRRYGGRLVCSTSHGRR